MLPVPGRDGPVDEHGFVELQFGEQHLVFIHPAKVRLAETVLIKQLAGDEHGADVRSQPAPPKDRPEHCGRLHDGARRSDQRGDAVTPRTIPASPRQRRRDDPGGSGMSEERSQQPGEVPRFPDIVGIQERHESSACPGDTCVARRTHAQIPMPCMLDVHDAPRFGCSQGAGKISAAVGAPVINEQQLDCNVLLRKDASNGLLEMPRSIQENHYHGNLRARGGLVHCSLVLLAGIGGRLPTSG